MFYKGMPVFLLTAIKYTGYSKYTYNFIIVDK